MTEQWRDIHGFEGKYQVSNHGRVRNIKFIGHPRSTKQERILVPRTNRYGYSVIHLSDGNKDFHPPIHRLVAMAFIPNPLNYPAVNHKDENKENNHAENLEWCTNLYNTRYGTGQLRAHEKKKKAIMQLDKNTNEVVKEYASATDASVEMFGTSQKKRAITCCARGERPTAYGYSWKYKTGSAG